MDESGYDINRLIDVADYHCDGLSFRDNDDNQFILKLNGDNGLRLKCNNIIYIEYVSNNEFKIKVKKG